MNPRVFEEIKETPMIEIIQSVEQHIDNNSERRKEIEFLLDVLEIPYETQQYSTGKNVFATLGKPPFIGIGSHYDAVPNSPGANDNASSMAVTLELLRRAKKIPLTNLGLRGFFFDQEEEDLRGSRAYVKAKGYKDLIGLYNLEMVGSGENIACWTERNIHQGKLLKILSTEAKKANTPIYEIPHISQFLNNAADHESFVESGFNEAFCITMISDRDVSLIRKHGRICETQQPRPRTGHLSTEEFLSSDLFAHYHRPTDTSEHLSEKTLEKITDILWNSIKSLDKTK